jgi:hypothetical protein
MEIYAIAAKELGKQQKISRKSRDASEKFSVSKTTESGAKKSVSNVSGMSSISDILALQNMSDAEIVEKENFSAASSTLSDLESMYKSIVRGDARSVINVSKLTDRTRSDNSALEDVIDNVNVLAKVQIAKAGKTAK